MKNSPDHDEKFSLWAEFCLPSSRPPTEKRSRKKEKEGGGTKKRS